MLIFSQKKIELLNFNKNKKVVSNMLYKLIALTMQRRSIRILMCIILSASQITHAAFTDDLTIGNAKALALGNAVTADPPGIDSIHFNPAGLTRMKGRQAQLKGISGIYSMTVKFGEYGDYQKEFLADTVSGYLDNEGNLTPEGEAYIYDEAYQTESTTEGSTVIIPVFGMVDIPNTAGGMGGFSYNPPGSSFTFGTNVYTPMISGFHRSSDDPGRFFQERSAATLLTYFSPSFGYEVSDVLSLGASVNFNYAGMGIVLPARAPHAVVAFIGSDIIRNTFCDDSGAPVIGELDVCGGIPLYSTLATLSLEVEQPLALGFNLGLLWSPEPWLTFGLAYNSRIKARMKGTYDFPFSPIASDFLISAMSGSIWESAQGVIEALGIKLPTAEEVANQGSGKIDVSYEFPQRLNFGVSVKITPKWKYNLDFKWTEWSAFSDLNLKFSKDIPFLEIASFVDLLGTGGKNSITSNSVAYQFGLRDVSYWAMGTEYQWNDQLAFRAGVENRPSALPDDHPNIFVPINDGYLYSFGISYDLPEKRELDFSIGYFSTKKFYPACSAQLGNGCNLRNIVYSPYQGEDVTTKVKFMLFELMYSMHF